MTIAEPPNYPANANNLAANHIGHSMHAWDAQSNQS